MLCASCLWTRSHTRICLTSGVRPFLLRSEFGSRLVWHCGGSLWCCSPVCTKWESERDIYCNNFSDLFGPPHNLGDYFLGLSGHLHDLGDYLLGLRNIHMILTLFSLKHHQKYHVLIFFSIIGGMHTTVFICMTPSPSDY